MIQQVRANYERIQSLSAEKLSLARKVYAYVEANLGKISQRMKTMEDEDQSLVGATNHNKKSSLSQSSYNGKSEQEAQQSKKGGNSSFLKLF